MARAVDNFMINTRDQPLLVARASIGGGRGGRVPHFSEWGDSIGIVPPPHFSVQKNCEAYSLTQYSSLLKAAT